MEIIRSGRYYPISRIKGCKNKGYILFVQVHDGTVIQEYVGTLMQAKQFRAYQLEKEYTHFIVLPKKFDKDGINKR